MPVHIADFATLHKQIFGGLKAAGIIFADSVRQKAKNRSKMPSFIEKSIFSLATAPAFLYSTVVSFGAGISASRRAWERVPLHELQSH